MKKALILAFTAVLFFGCAAQKDLVKQPTKESDSARLAIEQAKKDIADAKAAEAAKYAPEELASAETKIVIADESFAKDDFAIAETFAKKASEDAKLARIRSLATKAIEQAKADIKAAKEVDADKYAPEAMKSAAENLLNAQTAFSAKDWQKSYDLAVKASELAKQAIAARELSMKAEDAITQAKKDIADAKKAGAVKYAPELIKSAEENLELAESSKKSLEWQKAYDYAVKASDDAKAAKAACQAKPKAYKVVKGDNLWDISKKKEIFEDPFMWPLIYRENRDKIKDPNLIYPKQEFDIPAAVSDSDKTTAIDDAKKAPAKKKK